MDQTIINEGANTVNWSVWDVTQSVVNHPGKTDYQNYWVFFPINPNSIYGESGVNPQGLSSAWKGEVAAGVYGVQFVPSNQKIFADPDKGWIAYADLSDSVVFVKTFDVFNGAQYPDGGARVSVYVSGSTPPIYLEVEVKGPLVDLAPNGGSYESTENWFAARVYAPILDADSVGAIANRMSYNPTTQSLSGTYGVFYDGTANIAFLDSHGQTLGKGPSHPVSPLEEFDLEESAVIPDSARTVEVRIYDKNEQPVGVIESADVSRLLTVIETKSQTPVSEFRLAQNYPNPFNPTTAISYQLSAVSHVVLKIYDVLGREVKTLVNTPQNSGKYSVTFDARNLPSGIYFYTLRTESQSETKKLVLIK